MMRIQNLNENTKKNLLEDLLKRSPNQYTEYENRVSAILADVKEKKDEAIFDFTKRFDGAEITADTIEVTEEEIAEAYELVDQSLITIIRKAKENQQITIHPRNTIIQGQHGIFKHEIRHLCLL